MQPVNPLVIWSQSTVTLAIIGLIGLMVVLLRTAPLKSLAAVLTALAAVLGMVPAILMALHG